MEYINLATFEDTQKYLESDYITSEDKEKLMLAIEHNEPLYVYEDINNKYKHLIKPKSEIHEIIKLRNKKINRLIISSILCVIIFSLLEISIIMNPTYGDGGYSRGDYLYMVLNTLLVAYYAVSIVYGFSAKQFLKRTEEHIKDHHNTYKETQSITE